MSSSVKSVGRLAAIGVGLTGFLGGLFTEKYRNRMTVSAANPFSKDAGDATIIPYGQDKSDSMGSYPTKPSRISQIMKYGFPGMDNIRSFEDFVLSYDRRNRVPHWVFEHLTRHTCKSNPSVDRSKCDFFEDASVHAFFRSTNQDYKKSGYDRGHLAAAGNHRAGQPLIEETFILSNMCPQVGKGFNRDSWNRLEKYVRDRTKIYENVYVCTGPLYLPKREENGKYYVKYEVIGKNNVAVPTHFFKVIVGEKSSTGQLDMESFIMPNRPIDDSAPLDAFRVPVDAIERAAGLLFFDRIPKHNFKKINGR